MRYPLRRLIRLLLIITLFAAPLSFPAYAQNSSEQPLMRMLGLVPDIPTVRQAHEGEPATLAPWVMFANYRAALEADPTWPRPKDYADYLAQVEKGRPQIGQAPVGIQAGPALPLLSAGTGSGRDPKTLARTGPTVGEVLREKMGMDYFDIYYGMEVGNAPTRGLIFGGAFDLEAIGAAHQARGYTKHELQGLPLWCSSKPDYGCDKPTTYDPKGIEFYNLFDTRLGRQPALFGADRMIASAFDYNLLVAMAGAAADKQTSLADVADFRTLAEALVDPGRYKSDLMQAIFFQSASVVNTLDLTQYESFEAFQSQWVFNFTKGSGVNFMIPLEWKTYGPLPAYKMVALGNRQEGDAKIALIAVLYDKQADAEAALPELTARLTSYAGTLDWQQYDPLFGKDRLRASYVYTSADTGWSVAVVAFGNSSAQSKGKEGADRDVLAVCLRGILTMTFYPLWYITPSDWLKGVEQGTPTDGK